MKKFLLFPMISLLLEMVVSCFIPFDTKLWNSCFTLVSLFLLAPYFQSHQAFYLKMTCGIGLCYDILMTNMLLLNTFVFFILAFFFYHLYRFFSNSIVTSVITFIFSLFLYRSITYFLLVLMGYFSLDIQHLWASFTSSIVGNVGYLIILYYLVRWAAKKWKIIKFY